MISWWRLYLHVVWRGIFGQHRMIIAGLVGGGYHYFCSCGYYNEGKTLMQVLDDLKENR